VTTGHFSHLLLQLLTLSASQLPHALLLDMEFDSLPFLVLDFEDVLLVIFAGGSSHEHLVLRRILLDLVYLGENKSFSLLFFGVVD